MPQTTFFLNRYFPTGAMNSPREVSVRSFIPSPLRLRELQEFFYDGTTSDHIYTPANKFNFGGFKLTLWDVSESYEDENGVDTPYFPATSAMVTTPDCGHMMYGQRIGTRNVLCGKNAEIDLSDSEAKRIVALGIAEYIDRGVAAPQEDDCESAAGCNTPENKNAVNGVEIDESDTPEYSVDMNANELRSIAKQYGISFKIGTTKEDMVKTLDEYFSNGEDEPELTAKTPV